MSDYLTAKERYDMEKERAEFLAKPPTQYITSSSSDTCATLVFQTPRKAKSSCKKCHGHGVLGTDTNTDKPITCKCVK